MNPPVVYGDGSQSRDYMFGTDAADAYAKLGLVENIDGQVVNIGTGTETNIGDLARMIIKLMGSNLEPKFTGKIHPGEAGRLFCDPSKCMKILDWKPTVTLEEGLKKTIDYYLKHPELYDSLNVVV